MAVRAGSRFLRSMSLRGSAPDAGYPYDLPAVAALGGDPVTFGDVTVLVGQNGSGKSTLIEAIAVAAGLNAEGGSTHLRFTTMSTHSSLSEHLALQWTQRPRWGWFLRAETFYGMATHIADDDEVDEYGRPLGIAGMFPDLHARSHGESFLQLIDSRFRDAGFYVMDEPESALSFQGQLGLLRFMHDGIAAGSQFVIATHSPLLMRMPGAVVYELDDGITRCDYDDIAVVGLWRRFLNAPERMLANLFDDECPDRTDTTD
ncbi:MAG: AAA family ATPase [Ilumatobacteraceae bacterium]